MDSELFRKPTMYHTVLVTLVREGPATAKQLRERVGCARRTLYSALKWLIHTGVVVKRPYLRDTRQSIYALNHPGLVPR